MIPAETLSDLARQQRPSISPLTAAGPPVTTPSTSPPSRPEFYTGAPAAARTHPSQRGVAPATIVSDATGQTVTYQGMSLRRESGGGRIGAVPLKLYIPTPENPHPRNPLQQQLFVRAHDHPYWMFPEATTTTTTTTTTTALATHQHLANEMMIPTRPNTATSSANRPTNTRLSYSESSSSSIARPVARDQVDHFDVQPGEAVVNHDRIGSKRGRGEDGNGGGDAHTAGGRPLEARRAKKYDPSERDTRSVKRQYAIVLSPRAQGVRESCRWMKGNFPISPTNGLRISWPPSVHSARHLTDAP